jgi:hypothetical protein
LKLTCLSCGFKIFRVFSTKLKLIGYISRKSPQYEVRLPGGAERMKFSACIIPEFLFGFGGFISPLSLKQILQFVIRKFQKVVGGI